ncbi:unnamed protein product [Cladocopium goreaui]|uniref:Polymerase nucleotidyl transferase domain-containing protein n=1 Tax=Cladocopium goreaui TaxID=2562237 RepID=A0A9P1CMI8_9DINO|nr:unnamed protein product [Cladocopium goreaui]|mmetsp:Transcript_46563/g.101369  ORF Transcript_46563/g.101369 Transcript_46563/m.101369 type:complete len:233 (+) Transcript_46563:31-729(+)
MAKKGRAPCAGAKAANDARANALNPNNRAYDRDLAAQRDAKKEMGQREHQLNCLASRTPQQKAAYGRDVKKAVEAVHEALGGEFQLHKVGSRAKGTQSRSSDGDVKIMGPRPLTEADRPPLTKALQRRFPNVVQTDNIHKVRGESGDIDVVPRSATFFAKNFQSDRPKNPFKTNDQAMQAVRGVKSKVAQMGGEIRGHAVEQTVLRCQQKTKGANFMELSSLAMEELRPSFK